MCETKKILSTDKNIYIYIYIYKQNVVTVTHPTQKVVLTDQKVLQKQEELRRQKRVCVSHNLQQLFIKMSFFHIVIQ